jgi:membrane protein
MEAFIGSDDKWDKGARRILTRFLRYIVHTGSQFMNDHCFLRAAALTYTTLLTLIPILVLFFVMFQAFGGLETLRDRVEIFLFSHLLPESVANIRSYIQGFIYGFNSKAVSTISILFLIVAAYGLFSSIDTSLNSVWKVRLRHRFISRLVNLWFILTISPLFLGYSLYLSAKIMDFGGSQLASFKIVLRILLWGAPLFLTWVTLALIFRFVPRTHVTWRAAFLGGFFSAVLWEFSKYGFNVYVQQLANMKLLYGSFILLPLFLIWVDLSWVIVLAGAELSFTHQHLDKLHQMVRDRVKNNQESGVLPMEPALQILARTGESFYRGEGPISRTDLQTELNIDPETLDVYVKKLETAGFILPSEKENTVTLIVDLSLIELNSLFDLFEVPGTLSERNEGLERFLIDLRKQRRNWLSSINMNDVLKGGYRMDREIPK